MEEGKNRKRKGTHGTTTAIKREGNHAINGKQGRIQGITSKTNAPTPTDKRTDGRTDGRTDLRTDGRTYGRTDGRTYTTATNFASPTPTDRQTDRRTDGCTTF